MEFTKYFKREKLDVTEIVKCHESYINEIGCEAGFLDSFKNTKDATLICTLNGCGTSVEMNQKVKRGII